MFFNKRKASCTKDDAVQGIDAGMNALPCQFNRVWKHVPTGKECNGTPIPDLLGLWVRIDDDVLKEQKYLISQQKPRMRTAAPLPNSKSDDFTFMAHAPVLKTRAPTFFKGGSHSEPKSLSLAIGYKEVASIVEEPQYEDRLEVLPEQPNEDSQTAGVIMIVLQAHDDMK